MAWPKGPLSTKQRTPSVHGEMREHSLCPMTYTPKQLAAPERPALTSLGRSSNSHSFHLGFQCWFDTEILLILSIKAQGLRLPISKTKQIKTKKVYLVHSVSHSL